MYSNVNTEQGTSSFSTISMAKDNLFEMSVSQSFLNHKIRMKGFPGLLNHLNALIPNRRREIFKKYF